jgi:GNAT superfamily N-acetyltransferase
MPDIRKANDDDIREIEHVMRESIRGIASLTYDAQQVESCLRFVAHLDHSLIGDETYFVVESDDEIVACGGWSRRAKLYAGGTPTADEERLIDPAKEAARVRAMFVLPRYARQGLGRLILQRCEEEARRAGFTRVELMAMLSGEAMYLACGYAPVAQVDGRLPDGTPFPLTRMEKTLT